MEAVYNGTLDGILMEATVSNVGDMASRMRSRETPVFSSWQCAL